ncbi:MAG: acyl carrier protein [Deltaproteobacteria bacterium]|nr:acyl carrier protein [Deltaproteobacteria bacterium]
MAQELVNDAKDVICQTLEIDPAQLGLTTHFVDDLGIDSILIVELKTKFEEKYGIKIPKEDVGSLVTLNDVVAYLTLRLN